MKVYFVRHGETDFNLKKITMPGEIDHELNDTGIEQAREARDKLKDKSFDLIISSPMKRARKTAEIINEYHNHQIEFDDRIQERLAGSLTESGKQYNPADLDKMFDFDNELKTRGGETVVDFFSRVYDFLDDLSEQHGDDTVLVVSHGGVRHAFHAYFNDLPWKGNLRINRTANAEIVEFETRSRRKNV